MNIQTPVIDLPAANRTVTTPDQWLRRPRDEHFANLGELHGYTKNLADVSESTIHNASKVEVITDPRRPYDMSLGLPTGKVVTPNHYTFGQLCRLVKAPAAFLRDLPAPVAENPLSYKLATYRGELIKSYVNEETGELRSITSPNYGRVHDHEVVSALQAIAGNGTGDASWQSVNGLISENRVSGLGYSNPEGADTTSFFASDRDLFAFLVDAERPVEVYNAQTGETESLYRGIYAWNSEVGSKSLGIASFLFRSLCFNRLMFGVGNFEEVRVRHTSGAPDRFIEDVRPAIEHYAEQSAVTERTGIQSAMNTMLASDDDEVVAFLTSKKFEMSRKAAKAAIEQHLVEEGRPARSAWDVVQAVTAHARGIPHQSDRVDLEQKAGKLLRAAA